MTMALKGTQYHRHEPTLYGELTQDGLHRAIAVLPEGIYLPRDLRHESLPEIFIPDQEQLTGIKDGAFAEIEGKVVTRNGNRFEPTALSTMDAMRVRGLM